MISLNTVMPTTLPRLNLPVLPLHLHHLPRLQPPLPKFPQTNHLATTLPPCLIPPTQTTHLPLQTLTVPKTSPSQSTNASYSSPFTTIGHKRSAWTSAGPNFPPSVTFLQIPPRPSLSSSTNSSLHLPSQPRSQHPVGHLMDGPLPHLIPPRPNVSKAYTAIRKNVQLGKFYPLTPPTTLAPEKMPTSSSHKYSPPKHAIQLP